MKKKVLFLFFFLLLLYNFKAFSAIRVYSLCYQICVSDSDETACGIKCDTIIVIDVSGNGGGGNGGDTDNDDSGGGGGPGDFNLFDLNNDGFTDCWKDLTGSERITAPFKEERNGGCGYHTGLDIGTAQEGENIPLFSASSGTVTEIGFQATGGGYFIRVQNDNGSYTVYCHLLGTTDSNGNVELSNTNLDVGDRVYPGMEIAYTDSSPKGTSPHLDIKFYLVGNKSLSEVQDKFPESNLTEDDILTCTVNGELRTYVNPEKVLGDCK